MPELDGAGLEVDFEAPSGAVPDELDGAAVLVVGAEPAEPDGAAVLVVPGELAGAAELVVPEELELPHPATASAASAATSVASVRMVVLLCLARAISCILVLLSGCLLAREQVQARRLLTVSFS
jgi:hypothetical protein